MTATVHGSDPKWIGSAPRAQGPDPSPTTGTKPDSLADLDPNSEPQTAVEDAKNTGLKFAKTFLLVFPVYVFGYLGFSFSWILISLAVLFWLRRNQGTRISGVNKALAFFEHEEKAIKQSLPTSELPPWVSTSRVYSRLKLAKCVTFCKQLLVLVVYLLVSAISAKINSGSNPWPIKVTQLQTC